jgi:hypothetical protein
METLVKNIPDDVCIDIETCRAVDIIICESVFHIYIVHLLMFDFMQKMQDEKSIKLIKQIRCLKKATFHIHMKMAADLLISMPIAFPSVF